jgi:hypothetical protein
MRENRLQSSRHIARRDAKQRIGKGFVAPLAIIVLLWKASMWTSDNADS